MKVILQKDVKNLGKVGDVVSVKEGYARNFLFPQKMALMATSGKMKQWEHLEKVAEAKKKKAVSVRKSVVDKVNGHTVVFKAHASEADKLFGSITTHDISEQLEKDGFSIDRRDIKMDDVIKVLGQHKAEINLGGDELKAEITVSVERM